MSISRSASSGVLLKGVAIRLGEFSENRVDCGLARAERVLVAADANCLHSRRKLRSVHAALTALLHECHVFFVAARGHEFGGVRGTTSFQTLKETAARHRHGILLQLLTTTEDCLNARQQSQDEARQGDTRVDGAMANLSACSRVCQ
jgi:hypothetical protein